MNALEIESNLVMLVALSLDVVLEVLLLATLLSLFLPSGSGNFNHSPGDLQ